MLLVLIGALFVLGPTVGASPHPDQQMEPFPVDGAVLLDFNTSENASALLLVEDGGPYYEGEPFRLGVLVWSHRVDIGSVTETKVVLDVDGPVPHQNVTDLVYDWHHPVHAPGGTGEVNWTLFHTYIDPEATDRMISAVVEVGSEVLNLTSGIVVNPGRVILSAQLDVPPGTIPSIVEQVGTDVDFLLRNDGGGPAIDLVLDIRWDDRILETLEVPLVAAHGNRSLVVHIPPTYGGRMQVFLVQGAGAPKVMANFSFVFTPRGIMEVVTLEVDDGSVLEGTVVEVTAHLRNVGHADIDDGVVELLVDGKVVANLSVEGLRPSEDRQVTFKWVSSGPGIHSVSVRPGGTDVAAEPVVVEVGAKAPAAGPALVAGAFAMALLVTRAGWRSSRADRA
jgi:hypothetical protein